MEYFTYFMYIIRSKSVESKKLEKFIFKYFNLAHGFSKSELEVMGKYKNHSE